MSAWELCTFNWNIWHWFTLLDPSKTQKDEGNEKKGGGEDKGIKNVTKKNEGKKDEGKDRGKKDGGGVLTMLVHSMWARVKWTLCPHQSFWLSHVTLKRPRENTFPPWDDQCVPSSMSSQRTIQVWDVSTQESLHVDNKINIHNLLTFKN